jgi:hypothetical protein
VPVPGRTRPDRLNRLARSGRPTWIPLKDLPTTPPGEAIDWDDMAAFAASLLPDDEARRLAGGCDDDREEVTEARGTPASAGSDATIA